MLIVLEHGGTCVLSSGNAALVPATVLVGLVQLPVSVPLYRHCPLITSMRSMLSTILVTPVSSTTLADARKFAASSVPVQPLNVMDVIDPDAPPVSDVSVTPPAGMPILHLPVPSTLDSVYVPEAPELIGLGVTDAPAEPAAVVTDTATSVANQTTFRHLNCAPPLAARLSRNV
ncbi:hypothetical protein [Conexibacter woesei]|uniref:hypothetical protein n=1 Tax=Conexibacter woesei TaxID=191495 RepID=UPI0005A2C296|nr:hypothetical protein [Conexibacter woesei]